MDILQLDQEKEKKEKWLEFAKNPRGFLLFAGQNGTGKTFSAEAIFNAVKVPPHLEKMFYTQTDLNLMWQKDIKKWGDCTYNLERICEAKLLVLDDMGTRSPTEPFKDFLYAIFEKRDRIKATHGTIITTNLNGAQMREVFGDAITSRIASGHVFRFDGDDRRFNRF